MPTADPKQLPDELAINTAHRLEVRFWDSRLLDESDDTADMTGYTAKVFISNPSGSATHSGETVVYTVSWSTQASGQGYVVLSNSMHDTAGDATVVCKVDDGSGEEVMRTPRYTLTFVTELVAPTPTPSPTPTPTP